MSKTSSSWRRFASLWKVVWFSMVITIFGMPASPVPAGCREIRLRLLEDGFDFHVVDLRKVGVKLPHRAEEFRCFQTDHFVRVRADLLQRARRRDPPRT